MDQLLYPAGRRCRQGTPVAARGVFANYDLSFWSCFDGTSKSLTPGLPFFYSFLDEDYDRLYVADAKLGKVTGIFSMLAIFVGCLGLLGLTSFSLERRVKEISIRKILGPTSAHVVFIISRELINLLLIVFDCRSHHISHDFEMAKQFTDRITISPLSFIIPVPSFF